MARIQAPTATELRERLSAWARYVYEKNRYGSVLAMSKDMKFNQGSLTQIINGKGTTGLEFAVKLALVGQESLDTICLRDPQDRRFFRPGVPTPVQAAPGPVSASEEPASPRKRKSGNGR